MSNIFISYNRQSEAIARTLADDIKTLGHTVWFDQELTGGQAWWDQILATVRDCDLFVFILSPEALNSTACMREYGYAADLGKPILPILVTEGVSTKLLPPALSRIQFVDYRQHDRDAAFRLARALAAIPSPGPLPDPLPVPPEVPISYLGSLTEQIEMTSPLSYEKQSALVVDLKGSLRDPETTDDARTLLERLRKRRDLFVVIAEEIDELLTSTRKAIVGPLSTGPTEAAPDPLTTEPRQNESVRVVLPEPPAYSVLEGLTHSRLITAIIGVIIGALFGVISTALSEPILRESYPSVLRSWMWQFGLIDAVAGGIAGLIVGGKGKEKGKRILWAIGGSTIGAFIGLFLAYLWFAYAAGLAWGWAIGAVIGAFVGWARAEAALDGDRAGTE